VGNNESGGGTRRQGTPTKGIGILPWGRTEISAENHNHRLGKEGVSLRRAHPNKEGGGVVPSDPKRERTSHHKTFIRWKKKPWGIIGGLNWVATAVSTRGRGSGSRDGKKALALPRRKKITLLKNSNWVTCRKLEILLNLDEEQGSLLLESSSKGQEKGSGGAVFGRGPGKRGKQHRGGVGKLSATKTKECPDVQRGRLEGKSPRKKDRKVVAVDQGICVEKRGVTNVDKRKWR